MKRFWLSAAVIALVILGATGEVPAQNFSYPYYQRPSNPIPQAALSPYLNIRSGGTNPAINYFGMTLPEFDRRATSLQFRGALLELDRRTTMPLIPEQGLVGTLLPQTGHPVYYGNYGPYYALSPYLRPGQTTAPVTPALGQTAPTTPSRRGVR
jgi:hypothetical protein